MTTRRKVLVSLIGFLLLVLGVIMVALVFFGGSGKLPPLLWETQDLENIAVQIEVFKDQHHRYPTSEEGLDALVHKPTDPTVSSNWYQQMKFIDRDQWGHLYQYRCPGRRYPQRFDLYSLGPDGIESTDDIYFTKHRDVEDGMRQKLPNL